MQNQFIEKEVERAVSSQPYLPRPPCVICPMSWFCLRRFFLVFHDLTFSPDWQFLLRCHLRLFFLQSFNSQFSLSLHFWPTNTSSLLPLLADELHNSIQYLFLSAKPTAQMSTIHMSTDSLRFPIVTLQLKFPS